jgi:NADH-quinone oxidoreductase subunit M
MNASVIGLFSFNLFSLYGSLLNMIAHGFTSAALFFLVGILYKKFHTKNIAYYGGLASYMPNFHFFLIFFILSNIAFPGTFNFICEILILIGINS